MKWRNVYTFKEEKNRQFKRTHTFSVPSLLTSPMGVICTHSGNFISRNCTLQIQGRREKYFTDVLYIYPSYNILQEKKSHLKSILFYPRPLFQILMTIYTPSTNFTISLRLVRNALQLLYNTVILS